MEEIAIIDPDVIIGGIGNPLYWELLFPGMILQRTGFGISVSNVSRTKLVDFYHPSYRVPQGMSYALLKCVIESEVFEGL